MNLSFGLGLSEVAGRRTPPWWHAYRAGPGGPLPDVVIEDDGARIHGAAHINNQTFDLAGVDLSGGFTISMRGALDYTLGNGRYIRAFQIDHDGASADRHFAFLRETSGQIFTEAWTGNIQQFGRLVQSTAQPSGQPFRLAARFFPNDYAACFNGGSVHTDASGALPTGLNRLHLRSTSWVTYAGMVHSFALWRTPVDNPTLASLSLPP